jgi:hypothetical protein
MEAASRWSGCPSWLELGTTRTATSAVWRAEAAWSLCSALASIPGVSTRSSLPQGLRNCRDSAVVGLVRSPDGDAQRLSRQLTRVDFPVWNGPVKTTFRRRGATGR